MIRLVTSQDIKYSTPLGGNVDADLIMNFVDDVQTMVIEPILGTKLFDKILTDFDAGSLNGLYLQMVDDYLKKIICYSVFADYTKFGSITVSNGGVYRKTSDEAQLASESEIAALAKGYTSKADVYIGRLERFLCDQDQNIPEYTTNQDNDYDLDPRNDVRTSSGWYLRGIKKKDDYDFGVGTDYNSNNLELE